MNDDQNMGNTSPMPEGTENGEHMEGDMNTMPKPEEGEQI